MSIGDLMILTDEVRPAVSSSLVDLRDIPLAEMSALSSGLLDEAIDRVLPESPVPPVPVAAFQSTI
jgi:FXSXX-COOH protein